MAGGDRDKRALALLVSAVILASPATILSQDGREETSRALEWSLGAGLIVAPRPYLGAASQAFPVPVLNVSYERWFFQGIRGGYEWLRAGPFSASLFAQPQFRGFEPSDSPFLEGMEGRSLSMDGGAEVIYRGRPVGFRFAALSDVLGVNDGQEVSLLAVTGAPLGEGRLILLGFGPRWVSANRVDYYYGVRAGEATPARPAYTGSGTVSWDLNLTLLFDVDSRWTIFALVNREAFGSDIHESPIVDRDSTYGMIAALSYRF